MIPDMNHHGSMVRHHVPICFSMFFPINWPYLGGYCHISHQVAPCSAAALACHGTRTPTRWRSVWRTSKPGRSLRTHGMGFGWAMPAVWHFFWNILFGKPIRKPVWSPFDKEDVLSIYIYIYNYIYMILSDFWLAKIWSVHVSPGPLGDLVMPPWPAARPAGHWTMGCWSDASEFLTSQVWSSCGKSLDTPINSNKLNIWLWVKTLVPSYPQK